MARLDSICRINMGASPDSSTYNDKMEGLPFYQGNADFGEKHPTPRVWCNAPTKIAQKDDVLISVRAPIGALNIATEQCCIGRGLAALTVNTEICDTAYLWYGIRSKVDELNAKGTGSTFKAISRKALEETDIPLPDLPTQRRIAATLDKVSEGIAVCRQLLADLDVMVKARFVEMFGDPEHNQKGFPVYRMDEVVRFVGGAQPDKKFFEYEPTPDNIRLIQIRDYKSDKYITYIPKALAKRFCTADDIMIGRYGPPIFQILRGIEGAYNVALMKAEPLQGNKDYIREYLKQECLLHYLEGLSARTAGQDGIQMDALKAYPFIMPPTDLQEEFVLFVKRCDKSKSVVQQQLAELETLKKSLMQEYFG